MRAKVCKKLRSIARQEDKIISDYRGGKVKIINPHTMEQKALKKVWNSQPRSERYIK